MRILDTASSEYLTAHTGVASRHMVHVIARNRQTGAQEALGLWQGDDHLTIAIDGVNRTYYGAGGLIGVEPIRAGIGLEVRMLQATLRNVSTTLRQWLLDFKLGFPPFALVDLSRQQSGSVVVSVACGRSARAC